jgi:hypothetical protein
MAYSVEKLICSAEGECRRKIDPLERAQRHAN